MDYLAIGIILILIIYFFKDVSSPSKPENFSNITREYKNTFGGNFDEKYFNSDEYRMVYKTIKDKNSHLLELKEFPGFKYSNQEILNSIEQDLENTKDKEVRESILILWSTLFKPKEEFRDRIYRNFILTEFGKYCEKNPLGATIRDASKLPYPKDLLFDAFCKEYPLEKDEKMQTIMRCMVMELSRFQEGVGEEDLHATGIDVTKLDLKNLDAMAVAKQIASKDDEINKYRELSKLAEKEAEVYINELLNSNNNQL